MYSGCIQGDMPRCPSCVVEYKGHRSGSYHPSLKCVYERQGALGLLVKVGYRCPVCKKFFDINNIH